MKREKLYIKINRDNHIQFYYNKPNKSKCPHSKIFSIDQFKNKKIILDIIYSEIGGTISEGEAKFILVKTIILKEIKDGL